MTRIMKKDALLLGLIISMMSSCDRPACHNTNPVFERFSPEAKEYKDELARQLQLAENKGISYWFDKYEASNNREYILVYIQGKELCAKGFILVNDWKKLEGIRRTQGISYGGAELKGLRLDIRTDSAHTELIFKDVDYIID
jgi:hypothetical protein